MTTNIPQQGIVTTTQTHVFAILLYYSIVESHPNEFHLTESVISIVLTILFWFLQEIKFIGLLNEKRISQNDMRSELAIHSPKTKNISFNFPIWDHLFLRIRSIYSILINLNVCYFAFPPIKTNIMWIKWDENLKK